MDNPLLKSIFNSKDISEVILGEKPFRKASEPKLLFADPMAKRIFDSEEQEERLGNKKKRGPKTLAKAILTQIDGDEDSIQRLSFRSDPSQNNTYASIYKSKLKGIPDEILKRLCIQDDLVAAIVNTRASQVSSFGRPQPDRHSTGFKVIPDEAYVQELSEEEKEQLEKRISDLEKRIVTCGPSDGWNNISDALSFSQFLNVTTKNAVAVGRIAIEIVNKQDPKNLSEEAFAGFRPIDAGTIYQATKHSSSLDSVRASALETIKKLIETDKLKIDADGYKEDKYDWVQVIAGKPHQTFTNKECLVHTFYPVLDVELDGYPVTPLDTVIASVTTHINITTHNRMYFQAGRASRGMLVFKSDDAGEETISKIKHQFQASINNVGNSWRMPVFAVGSQDDVQWQAIDNGSRDMEFQYLSDTTARVIMSAFQISPEELPGYQHLSRGTNNQSLSESNNEYKLQAARDVGIRPLLAQFEDFINARIMPLLDKDLAKFCVFKFVGLDAETPEKESIRLQNEQSIHMTYDEVLRRVEKQPVGEALGGNIPLNPLFNQVLDKYFTVGEILEKFVGIKDASKNPDLAYRRDPFFFQFTQMKMEMAQAQAQQQQAQQQGPPQQGQGQPQEGGGQEQQAPQEGQPQQQPQTTGELSSGLEQAVELLSKSERQLPINKRKLLEQHRAIVDKMNASVEADLNNLILSISDAVSKDRKS